MLFDTPIPTFPLDGGKGLTGAVSSHQSRLSIISKISHH